MQQADVAIIGGGIVGLATAYNLTQRFPERRVVVLEKRNWHNTRRGIILACCIPAFTISLARSSHQLPRWQASYGDVLCRGRD
jgi:glycine/D-amino acid oxidase-like deaminating enzyme